MGVYSASLNMMILDAASVMPLMVMGTYFWECPFPPLAHLRENPAFSH